MRSDKSMELSNSAHVASLQYSKQRAEDTPMILGPPQQQSATAYGIPRPRIQGQITPPLTPAASDEDLAAHNLAAQMQLHNYLRAFYPFHPVCDGSSSTVTLPLNEGDVVLVHSIHESGWADGTLLGSGHRGWLPTNYCEAYNPEPIRNLMTALTHFYDLVRGGAAGHLAPFYSQDYTRGIIAGVRYLLVCLRESPLTDDR